MTLTPSPRRFALTVHIVSSVGWVGAVAGFLVLARAGRGSPDVELVRASYIAMDLTYRSVVIPLGLASLASGIVSSLGTDWGLFRHYWVVVKLLLTVPAVTLMLLHMQPVGHMAGVAAAQVLSSADSAELRLQLLTFAIAALVVLLAATILSTFKPRGRIAYGARKLQGLRAAPCWTAGTAIGGGPSLALKVLVGVLTGMIVVVASAHLTGFHHP